jgi:hypothetical protein
MIEEKEFNIDPSWKGVIKWGGFSLFAAGLYPLIFVLLVSIMHQTLPVPAKETLEAPGGPTMFFVFAAIGEMLLMPGVLGLYFALKDVKRTAMFVATGLWLAAVPMFLASRALIISLSQISGRYLNAASETMKAAYLASAEHAIGTESVFSTMALVLLCVASIIIGLVMLKGVLGKRIGYLVIVAGIWTLFTPFGVILLEIPTIIPLTGLILTAIWQLIIGARLYKLGRDA